MDNAAGFLIPLCLLLPVFFGLRKGIPIFSVFSQGAKEGLQNCLTILPTLIGLLTATSMLRASGAFELLSQLLQPATDFLGIPSQVLPLALMKPFSGSGSTALLTDVFSTCGPDSFPGRVASVLAASSETTFYCIAVYFGAVNIQKTRHAVLCALLADVAAFAGSFLFVGLFFQNG